MQVTAYVALGTNLGSLRENLDGALMRLREKGLADNKGFVVYRYRPLRRYRPAALFKRSM